MKNVDNRMERRSFLKLSAVGMSAGALFPSFMAEPQSKKHKTKIVCRTLGRTGLQIPLVSLGAMRGDNKALVEAAFKMGIKHFDTANSYQNGKNEEMLGEVFKNHKRKEYIIATKVLPDDMDRKTGELGQGATAEKLLQKLDASLARLQLPSVDILYIHALSSAQAVLHPEMLKAMAMATQQGKTRFVGISTHQNEPEVLRAMIEAGVYDVALVAFNFKQDHRNEVLAAIHEAHKAGIGIVAMKTMAGGFLDKEKTKPVNTKAALKWVLQNESVCTSIPGFTTFEQLEESFSIMGDLKLTAQEEADLESALVENGLFCNQCGACLNQCQNGLPVNDIMRAYMYTYGYNNRTKAKQLLVNANVSALPCNGCDVCTVTCTKHFDVPQKVADVARLVEVPDEFLA